MMVAFILFLIFCLLAVIFPILFAILANRKKIPCDKCGGSGKIGDGGPYGTKETALPKICPLCRGKGYFKYK